MRPNQFNHVQFRALARHGVRLTRQSIQQIEQAIRRHPDGNTAQGITLLGRQDRHFDLIYEVTYRGNRLPVVVNDGGYIVTVLPRNRQGRVNHVIPVDRP